MARKKQDFVVEGIVTPTEDNTVVLTSSEDIEQRSLKLLLAAMQKYDYSKEQYSVQFSGTSAGDELTLDRLKELLRGINSSLSNVTTLNQYVHQYILLDDVLGATYTAIKSNINTEYVLSYNSAEGRNKLKQLNTAKEIITQFNKSIRIEKLIEDAVLTTIADGNYIMYLRQDGGNAVVDHYPLGVAEITDYEVRGYPIAQINLSNFKSRLRKTYTKNKSGKALYFENEKKEVAANFPPEVVTAYNNGETYARLAVENTGIMRINNFGGKYGVSHFAKALKPAVILDGIESTDIINNKAKAKKILHQILNKEVMGPDYNRKGFEYAAYAHNELMKAWANQTVLVTTIPAVKEIKYVEPKVEGTPTEKIALYRNEKISALGIGYIDPNMSSVSAANISIKQLMKVVDSVADQLSDILHNFYVQVLLANNVDPIYAPEVKVLDSAQMEMDTKRILAETLYTKFGLSITRCLEILGLNASDEAAQRQYENENGYDDIFKPRQTAYTTSGGSSNSDSSGGRPQGDDPEKQNKQEYDKTYRENV